uniref:Transposase MuDR plant domain-containing protein n=1 Tax=Oryza barthii TaxID=65489 RepID=A0A0D3ENT1_9ORYZ
MDWSTVKGSMNMRGWIHLGFRMDVTNFKDFLGDICEKYPWGLNETVSLHYIHASSKELIPICKDQDLTTMFECFHHSKRGKVVITLGNQINLFQAIVPCTPSLSVPSQAFFTLEGSTSQASKSDAYLENPFPHYEHVGVDDEKQYTDDYSSESDDSIAETDNVAEVEGEDDLSITDSDDEELWMRSKFSTHSKVDYITNNLVECFDNWIRKHKGLMPYELVDKIRKKVMDKFRVRKKVAAKLEGNIILPCVMKELLEKSRGLNFDLDRSDDFIAKVTDKDLGNVMFSMAIVPLQQVAAPVAKGKGKGKGKEKEKGKEKGKWKKDEKEDKDKKIKRKPSPIVQPTTPPAKRRKNNEVPQDSPAMRTRSKKSSPAMGTRSKSSHMYCLN